MEILDAIEQLIELAVDVGEQWPESPDNWFAVTEITNNTGLVINYAVRWGDQQWTGYCLSPGRRMAHSWPFSRPNENWSPVPFILFDCNLASDEIVEQEYRLVAGASPHSAFGHGVEFHFTTSNYGRLDLARS